MDRRVGLREWVETTWHASEEFQREAERLRLESQDVLERCRADRARRSAVAVATLAAFVSDRDEQQVPAVTD
jgi:hypothetical protein